jgi:tetratricopeptide (TPR) repeat protein
VEGHFWAGVNLALYAQARKGLKGLLALLEARRDLKRACEISEEYHGAGPLRVLGRLEHRSSKVIPKVMGGGSLERSRNYYDQALAIAPTNSVTLVYAAELELDCRNSKKAVCLLERILSLPIDPDWEFENIRDKNLAKSLLEALR